LPDNLKAGIPQRRTGKKIGERPGARAPAFPILSGNEHGHPAAVFSDRLRACGARFFNHLAQSSSCRGDRPGRFIFERRYHHNVLRDHHNGFC
jgi:hypothetical protein